MSLLFTPEGTAYSINDPLTKTFSKVGPFTDEYGCREYPTAAHYFIERKIPLYRLINNPEGDPTDMSLRRPIDNWHSNWKPITVSDVIPNTYYPLLGGYATLRYARKYFT